MKVFYTKTYNMGGRNAIKQNLIGTIAHDMGAEEISLFKFPDQCDSDYELDVRIEGIMAALEDDAVVLFQYPSMVSARYDKCAIKHIKQYHRIKLIIMVQDLGCMVCGQDYVSLDEEIDLLNQADLLILQSEMMHRQLVSRGLYNIPVLYQDVWEYPYDVGVPKIKIRNRIDHVMDFSQQAMLCQQSSGIIDINVSNNPYLDICNPLEHGYCICAGIPVLAREGTQAAKFIEEFGVGFLIDFEMNPEIFVSNLTADEIDAIQENMKSIVKWIQGGLFTKTLLQQAIYNVCINCSKGKKR